jgi:hypothetical protein
MQKESKPEKRLKHLENLGAILNAPMAYTKYVFQKLKGIEMSGHRLATQYCNGEIQSDEMELFLDNAKNELKTLLPENVCRNIHLNTDPRGYFLKLDDDYVRNQNINIERDWGGYGILCPEGV